MKLKRIDILGALTNAHARARDNARTRVCIGQR